MLLPEIGPIEKIGVTAPAAESPSRGGGELILLVDDHPAIRKAARRLLEAEGYRVVDVEDGEDALEVAAGLPCIDLLCADLVMPKMGGYELAKELARRAPGLRTLFMSAYFADVASFPLAEDEQRATMITKPFTRQSLLSAVRACLDRP